MTVKRPSRRASGADCDPMQIKYVATDTIFPNPSQPRIRFDRKDLIRLADSIKRYGIIQPLTVKKLNVDFKEYVNGSESKGIPLRTDEKAGSGVDENVLCGQANSTDDKNGGYAEFDEAVGYCRKHKPDERNKTDIISETDENFAIGKNSEVGNALEEIFKSIADGCDERKHCSEVDGFDNRSLKTDGNISKNSFGPESNKSFSAKSYRKTQNGVSYILHGDLIAKYDEKETFYELISGERRLRAARLLGMQYVPCIVSQADEKSSAEIAMVENIIRQDLNMFEEACAIERLINSYAMTQDQVAKRLSMSQSAVANKLRLLKLTENERDLICEYALSERHARALLKVDDVKKRTDIINKIYVSKMNVAATEQYIDSLLVTSQKGSNLTENAHKKATFQCPSDLKNVAERAIEMIKSVQPNANIKIKETKTTILYSIEVPKTL